MNVKTRSYCGLLNKTDISKEVTLMGFVDAVRDHGHLLFIHLRDIKGIIQVVFGRETDQEAYELAQTLRSEYVIEVHGLVSQRKEDTTNPQIDTGEIEVLVHKLIILNKSKTPPFMISEKGFHDSDTIPESPVDEDIRLQYRYLDLRRQSMQQHIIKRHEIIQTTRQFLNQSDFLDIETPILTKSTPEGARDYLVPSRIHEGQFYALPQSPQLFKQLLMMSGFERYYQIVKCFRDEDLRPNRQPEFTQIDIEASFIDESFVYSLIESLMESIFKSQKIDIPVPFPRITYHDAINLYGNDHPDLRFDMKMVDVTDLLTNVGYSIFKTIIAKGGIIKGINLKGQASKLGKNTLQNELAKDVITKLGGKGLTWMKVEDGKLASNIVQFFNESEQAALQERMGAENNDVLFFVADTSHRLVNEVLGRFRLFIAKKQDVIPKNFHKMCWVTDFPLFEEKEGVLTPMHHPFTSPSEDIRNITDPKKLLAINARAYDLVINGEEVGGGSIRIFQPEIQHHLFKLLGFTDTDIDRQFGFFVRALQYGTPPHGGIALGLDRLLSIILNTPSIREVIPFPKNRTAMSPLTSAPSLVSDEQLKELHIKHIQD
ncbi:MAG: aspartate--tRNA ligase [Candidatus Margulisbacteria bacterium]|nr:aspartate--tRNA ligase [Candidatus Margulisiibacteriota bacterium]